MMKVLDYTNKGNRPDNQDYTAYRIFSEKMSLFVVADGMGGYAHGEIASQVVAESIVDYIDQNRDKSDVGELIKEALRHSDEMLMRKRNEMGVKMMGTVVALLLIKEGTAYISWIGDSRVYIFRERDEVYKTRDHSLINEMKEKNKNLSAAELENYSSIVTKSIMGDCDLKDIPVEYTEVEPGDCYVLCSDGVHKDLGIEYAKNYTEEDKNLLDFIGENVEDNFSFIKVMV